MSYWDDFSTKIQWSGSGLGCLPAPGKRRKRSILRTPNTTRHGDDYIINGESVANYHYPWMIMVSKLHIDGSDSIRNRFVHCTASLITSKHALTALHCVNTKFAGTAINVDDGKAYGQTHEIWGKLQISFGPMEILDSTDLGSIPPRRIVRRVHVPPKTGTGDHDLAMLEFDEVVFSDHIRPICLPISGFPEPASFDFTMAGFGVVNEDTKEKPEYLQQLTKVTITSANVLTPEPYSAANGQLVFKGVHGGLKAAHFQYKFEANAKSAGGDSGGPIMAFNPASNRYTIVGVHTHGETTGLLPSGMKVHHFLNWILDHIKPGGTRDTCVHEDCKLQADQAVKRTWVLQVESDINIYKELASPCHYVPEMNSDNNNKFICPVDLSADRVKTLTQKDLDGSEIQQRDNRWRFCTKNCANHMGQDWDAGYYLDEITAGSFVQPKYTGLEPPEDHFINIALYNTDPKREEHVPHTTLCDVDNEGGHTYCPRTAAGGGNCILSENICDGHFDCEDGWDESPHLCIGKCDLWRQYQYPNLANYPDTDVKDPPPDVYQHHAVPASLSAKACHDHCIKKKKPKCTHFNWFGNNENPRYKVRTCEIYRKIDKTDKDAFVKVEDENAHYAIRGPRQCPGMFKKVVGKYQCKPVHGVPFQSGIYLIQAYNGQFLTNGGGKPKLKTVAYTAITKNVATTLRGKWWMKLFASDGELQESYFIIHNTFDQKKKEFLTFNKQSDTVSTEPLEQETVEKTPLWNIVPANPERGFTQVKIYAQVDGEKHYLTVPLDHYNLFKEFHFKLRGAADHVNDTKTSQLIAINEELKQDSLRQTFSFFECENDNKWVKLDGVLRRKPDYELDTLESIMKEIFTDVEPANFAFPKNMDYFQGEVVFMGIFGISQARYYQMYENLKKRKARVHLQIINAIKDSSSIFDYAGKMRIKPVQFAKMYQHWEDLAAKKTPYSGCKWDKCQEHMAKIQIYVIEKVETNFLDTTKYKRQP